MPIPRPPVSRFSGRKRRRANKTLQQMQGGHNRKRVAPARIWLYFPAMPDNPVTDKPAAGTYCVAALYHFADFSRYETFREPLQALCDESGVKGTLLIAREGINGTVAGTDAAITRL